MGSWALLPQGCLDDPAAAACVSRWTARWMDLGWEKKLRAQPRIRLAWPRVAGLFSLALLDGMSSETEACHSSKIV